MKSSQLLKLSPIVVVLALCFSARADVGASSAAPDASMPVATAPDQQQDLVPEPPNDAAAEAAAASAPSEVDPAADASQFVDQPTSVDAAPVAEEPTTIPVQVVHHKPHVKTAKEQLAFDKKLMKDTKSKIAKTLQQERQGDKDMKKAKAAIKTAEANLATAKKKKAKLEASLKSLEKTRVALEKTVKKTTVAIAKDTKRANNRLPASAR